MKYITFVFSDAITLDDAVNEAISQGWEPLGGVSVAATVNPTVEYGCQEERIYVQAMIKREDTLKS